MRSESLAGYKILYFAYFYIPILLLDRYNGNFPFLILYSSCLLTERNASCAAACSEIFLERP